MLGESAVTNGVPLVLMKLVLNPAPWQEAQLVLMPLWLIAQWVNPPVEGVGQLGITAEEWHKAHD